MSQSESEWVRVYTGVGARLLAVEDALRRAGFSPARLNESVNMLPVWMAATPAFGDQSLLIPKELCEARWDELQRLIPELSDVAAREDVSGNPELAAEAEREFDVRGCPNCGLFLNDSYARCPGCGTELVPAVEIFAEGQLEPDRVIVADGPAPAMIELREHLQSAGFTPEAFEVEGWTTDAVDLPWQELIGRTADVENVLGSRRQASG